MGTAVTPKPSALQWSTLPQFPPYSYPCQHVAQIAPSLLFIGSLGVQLILMIKLLSLIPE